MSYFGDAARYLIGLLFGLYSLAVMLRLLLQLARANFYNPLAQALVKITNPPLVPLRRIIPGLGGIDLASVVLLLALQILEGVLIAAVTPGVGSPPVASLLILSLASLLRLLVYVYFFSILIQIILSWVRPGDHNPLTDVLYSLNEPLLGPARRLLPPISGLDLSPILVIVLLQLTLMLIIAPLTDWGQALSAS
jgi:YggT family protein